MQSTGDRQETPIALRDSAARCRRLAAATPSYDSWRQKLLRMAEEFEARAAMIGMAAETPT